VTAALLESPEQQLARRLRGIDLGRGPLEIEPLPGGITNYNFRVRAGGDVYVARLSRELPLLGIDRRSELVCHQAATARGVAPEVVNHQDGLLVTRFVAGRTLDAAGVREPGTIARLGSLFRRLHEGWDALTGEMLYFCPFQTIRTYARSAARLGAVGPDDLTVMVDDSRRLSRRIAPFRPVLCHNDMMPANLIDDGQALWLVDWEYGAVGHPLFDLANAAANAAFSPSQDQALLAAYRDEEPVDPRELAELRILKAASFLRDALWATIQTVASDIEFDYHRYADGNYQAYREACTGLEVAGALRLP
jgi:thiamine kinase-like enzyme